MKTKYKSLILVISFLICYACEFTPERREGPKIIEIANGADILKLDVEVMDIIKLESKDSTLVGYASSVKYANNRFFLFDRKISRSLFAFDTLGRFLNKTSVGRGPGELIFPTAFTIDKEDEQVLIFDQGSYRVTTFDRNLNYINHSEAKGVLIDDMATNNDSSFLVRHRDLKSKNIEGADFYAYTLYYNDFQSKHHFDIILKSNTTATSMGNPIIEREGSLYFISEYDYTIYKLDNNTLTKAYIIECGEEKYSEDELYTLSTSEMFDQRRKGNKIVHFNSLLWSDDFIVITYFTDTFQSIFYSPKNGKVYDFDYAIENGSLPKCKLWGSIRQNLFFATVDPTDLIKYNYLNNRDAMMEVSETDNPYIITFKVKIPK